MFWLKPSLYWVWSDSWIKIISSIALFYFSKPVINTKACFYCKQNGFIRSRHLINSSERKCQFDKVSPSNIIFFVNRKRYLCSNLRDFYINFAARGLMIRWSFLFLTSNKCSIDKTKLIFFGFQLCNRSLSKRKALNSVEYFIICLENDAIKNSNPLVW